MVLSGKWITWATFTSRALGQIEEHIVDGQKKTLLVHRKGATRAFPPHHPMVPKAYQDTGQPVIIGGTMGTCSYVLTGTEVSATYDLECDFRSAHLPCFRLSFCKHGCFASMFESEFWCAREEDFVGSCIAVMNDNEVYEPSCCQLRPVFQDKP